MLIVTATTIAPKSHEMSACRNRVIASAWVRRCHRIGGRDRADQPNWSRTVA